MVVQINLLPDGVIKSVSAKGHAGDEAAGRNLACAAATTLLRTAYRTAVKNKNILIDFTAEKPGSLFFEVKDVQKSDVSWITGVTDFLITGLKDLETEYPETVKVKLNYFGGS